MEKNIGAIVSQSIKENCWLSIKYKNNTDNSIRYFWCAIEDCVDIERRKLKVVQYNYSKNKEVVLEDAYIFFDNILDAKVIEQTINDNNDKLVDKIVNNINKFDWLCYDNVKYELLTYYKQCVKYDVEPTTNRFHMVDEIDLHSFDSNYEVSFTNKQLIEIIEKVYNDKKYDLSKLTEWYEQNKFMQLAINCLSIANRQGKIFTLLYRPVKLDIKNKKIVISTDTYINNACKDENVKYSIYKYLDAPTDECINDFKTNYLDFSEEIQSTFIHGEKVDCRPYFIILNHDLSLDYESEFLEIIKRQENNELETPLKCFFGNISKSMLRKRGKSAPITIVNKKTNIDQLRVIHNAMQNAVTYVQGPPGTGKTDTILSVIISAFFNRKTILVTSNNNKPVDGIYEKINSYTIGNGSQSVYFPMLRLGNNDEIDKTLSRVKKDFNTYSKVELYENNLRQLLNNRQSDLSSLNEILKKYEEKEELEKRLEVLKKLAANVDGFVKISFDAQIEYVLSNLNKIGEIKDEDALSLINSLKDSDDIFKLIHYYSIERLQKLKNEKYRELLAIINMEDSDNTQIVKRRILFNRFIKKDYNLNLLLNIFPIILTTNISSSKLGKSYPNFDLVIMDEAGQCAIAQSLIPISRGKNLLLVGDENQLEPVIILDERMNENLMRRYHVGHEYNYRNNSILRCMQQVDRVSKFILLRNHYRCSKNIVQFSNKRYYDSRLIINTKEMPDSLKLLDVKTTSQPMRNSSFDEINCVINDIKHRKIENEKIGIITPFRNQADMIKTTLKECFPENKNISVGTVHSFQGDEKNIIYLSFVVTSKTSEKTYRWLNNNRELINVATTRAKNELVVVGDVKTIKYLNDKDDDVNSLIKYVESKGNIEVFKSNCEDFVRKTRSFKQYNSKAENEFIETISHYLTTSSNLVGHEHVRVATILKDCPISDRIYFLSSEFDYVLFENGDIPILAIEINGKEHYTNLHSMQNDEKKRQICEAYGIKLISIPNINVRRYEYIISLIEATLKGE